MTPIPQTTEMIPFTAPPVVVPEKQSGYIDAMIEAARLAQKPGWGADGTIKGIGDGEEVRSQRLWIDPNFPIAFTQADLDQMRRALLTSGQQNVIHVVKLPNPEALASSHDGTTEQDLLIADVDGALIFLAAAGTSLDSFRVAVKPYAGEYYQYLLGMADAKAQQYHLRRFEKGRLYLRSRAAYEAEQAWRVQHGEPPLKRFPGMRELSPRFGCASEQDLSACVQMAQFPDAIIALLNAGKITEDHMREMVALPPEKRLEAAQQLAVASEETGKPLLRPAARAALRLVSDTPKHTQVKWESVTQHIPVASLWAAQATTADEELPVPVIIGRLMHDMQYCLDALGDETPKAAQGFIKKARALLEEDAIRQLIASVQPTTIE
jgi:hypothetical protein